MAKMDKIVTQHIRECFRVIGHQNPLMKCIETENLTLLASLKKEYRGNYILGASPPEDKDTRTKIIATAHDLQAIPFTWFSYPLNETLITELSSAGLKQLAPLTGVSYDLRQEQPSYPFLAASLKMTPVKSATNFEKFLTIFEKTWNYPKGYGEFFFSNLFKSERFTFFLTHRDEEPIGICVLDIQEEIAGCYWDCVLPDYRKQGIGTFMVHHRLRYAQEKGCTTVVAQCLNSSVNVYSSLGFQKVCDMALFRYSGPIS